VDNELDKEVDTLARTLWGEARGAGDEEMRAVASVISNRVQVARSYQTTHATSHPLFGDGTFTNCCRRNLQFSCWNANDPNRSKLLGVDDSDPQFEIALEIAGQALAGTLEDNTDGATHYYERHIRPPEWAHGKTPCARIGNHLFFRDI